MAQTRRKLDEAEALDLAALGLDAAASTVYGQLLRAPDADTLEIAKSTHASRASVEAALSQLIRAGLARSADRPSGVEALRPEAALAQQISLKQRDAVEHVSRLTDLREEITGLERVWRRHHRGEVESGEFEIVRGLDAINGRLNALFTDCRARTLSLVSYAPDLWDNQQLRLTIDALARGVELQSVCGIEALADAQHVATARRISGFGYRERYAAAVSVQLRVIDDAAILPLDPANTSRGIIVTRAPGLVRAAESTFWLDWNAAVDIDSPSDGSLRRFSGVDNRLPQLLATGAPDDAIARLLGVSARTIRRQVATLMEEFRTQSRLQLGVALERHGLMRTSKVESA